MSPEEPLIDFTSIFWTAGYKNGLISSQVCILTCVSILEKLLEPKISFETVVKDL